MNYIYLLSESSYTETIWYKRILSGITGKINQRRESIRNLTTDDISRLPAHSVLLIIGFSKSFLARAVDLCIEHGVRPLIVGSSLTYISNQFVSFVTTSREMAMYENVACLFNSGCKRIAMLGVNPHVATDMAHKEGYCRAVAEYGFTDYEKDIFYNSISISKSIDAFLAMRQNYDAVVCTNDFVAIMLLSYLNELGIKVPDEIAVTGAGNVDCCNWTEPSLTSIDIHLEVAGKNAVILYHTLCSNPSLHSLNSSFGYNIVYRGSTMVTDHDREINRTGHQDFEPLLNTDYENDMKPIWNIANAYLMLDEVDRKIISGILQNLSNSKLAEKTFISESTLHYRLNKLYKSTGTFGKSELKAILKKYFPNYDA